MTANKRTALRRVQGRAVGRSSLVLTLSGPGIADDNPKNDLHPPAADPLAIVNEKGQVEPFLLESLEEHLSLKRVLADMVALTPEDPQFGPKLHVLAEQLEHHHKEEEDHLFPKAKKLLDAGAREALGVRMQARVDLLKHQAPRERIVEQTDEAAPLPDA